jgi:hypothetical protein
LRRSESKKCYLHIIAKSDRKESEGEKKSKKRVSESKFKSRPSTVDLMEYKCW